MFSAGSWGRVPKDSKIEIIKGDDKQTPTLPSQNGNSIGTLAVGRRSRHGRASALLRPEFVNLDQTWITFDKSSVSVWR